MIEWRLAEAKNKFSEVFTKALEEGPQRVTRRGKAVIIVSEEEFCKGQEPEQSFIEFLLSAPKVPELDLTRERDFGRDVEW
ncbi:MAG: type II toxin-antitoxin system Phd/YefM family antitoxin [Thermomicrobiales bacterium]|nr:type II toxin-antitoxin system Phd/YefM family antitoxin [Thermomicrobiales bacterium]